VCFSSAVPLARTFGLQDLNLAELRIERVCEEIGKIFIYYSIGLGSLIDSSSLSKRDPAGTMPDICFSV
jgi:hypothetical protein